MIFTFRGFFPLFMKFTKSTYTLNGFFIDSSDESIHFDGVLFIFMTSNAKCSLHYALNCKGVIFTRNLT